jgi:flagellar protein FlaJ
LKIEKDNLIYIACIISASFLVYINISYFSNNQQLFGLLNGVSILIGFGIPFSIKYQKTKTISEIERRFPIFLNDITTNIRTGMSLPQAIRAVKDNNYGPLSKYVKEIYAKLDWGIDFEIVLLNFAEKVKSKTIKRSVMALIETHRSGGKIGDALTAVAESQQLIENIKKERRTAIYGQMVNGYVIFLVFLGVMFALSKFLLPMLGGLPEAEAQKTFTTVFRNMVIIQALFSGLAIGKMSEGSIFAGFKHSLILLIIGYMIFSII